MVVYKITEKTINRIRFFNYKLDFLWIFTDVISLLKRRLTKYMKKSERSVTF